MSAASFSKDFAVRDFGAHGDGVAKDTAALQAAIDACAAAGGGRVIFEAGVYLTGSLLLRSGVELHLKKGARLLGSPDCADWKDRPDARHIDSAMCPRRRSAALLFADEADHVALTGEGVIDGNGYAFVEPDPESPSRQLRRRFDLSVSPPRLVFFAGCRDVRVEGVTVVNPPAGWSFWVHDCDRVRFADMAVESDVNFPNNDGIHVNCSRDVEIDRCRIETGDDSIVVRANSASLRENRVCERVRVADCSLRSYSCGVRVGWLNDGVIRDCSFDRLDIRYSVCGIGVFLPDWHSRDTWPDQGREATDISDLEFTDVRMDAVCARPVYVHISGHSGTKVRSVRGLRFRNVVARGLMHPVVSAPRPGLVSDISFVDCRFTREPASPERYPNGGNVGFAECQRFPDDIPDANVENIRRTRTTLA
jgi:polygalacturonase